MVEFSAAATLEVELDQRSVQDVRKKLEDELDDVPISMRSGSTAGSRAGVGVDIAEATDALSGLAEERNEILEDILDELEERRGGGVDLKSKGGGGGGSGVGTPVPFVVPFGLPGSDKSPNQGPTNQPTPTPGPVQTPSPQPRGPTSPNTPREPGPGGVPTFERNPDTAPPSIVTEPRQKPTNQPSGTGLPNVGITEAIGGAITGGIAAKALSEFPLKSLIKSGLRGGKTPSPGVGFPAPINPETISAVNETIGLPIPSFGPEGRRQQPRAIQARQPTITTTRAEPAAPGPRSSSQGRRGATENTGGVGNATSSAQRQEIDITVQVQPQKPKQSVIDEIKRQIDRELGKDFNLGLGVL